MGDASAQMSVRPARPIDLPRITAICLAGLPDDPTFDYLWRYRAQYPDDNHFFWQQRLKAGLFDAKRVVLVAVVQDSVTVAQGGGASEGKVLPIGIREDATVVPKTKETIVAFAVWEVNVKGGANSRQRAWLDRFHDCLTGLENWGIARRYKRRDGDPLRLAEFGKVLDDVHKQYWEKEYARNYHLELLVTHPDYRRRGAGTKLTGWGIEKASECKAHVGVESSAMGFSLYRSLGFKLCEDRPVQVKDEAETLSVKVMVFPYANGRSG